MPGMLGQKVSNKTQIKQKGFHSIFAETYLLFRENKDQRESQASRAKEAPQADQGREANR